MEMLRLCGSGLSLAGADYRKGNLIFLLKYSQMLQGGSESIVYSPEFSPEVLTFPCRVYLSTACIQGE